MSLLLTAFLVVAAFLGGLAAGQRTKADPGRYWGFLGGGLVLTTALMAGGYTWYDEWFLVGLLLADPIVRVADSSGKVRRPPAGARWGLFSFFCIYAVFEGVRGLFYFAESDSGALQKLRWLVFFVLLLLAATKGKQLWEQGVRPRGAARTITTAGLIFTLVYGAISLYAFVTVGTFAGSQYAQRADARVNSLVEIFGTTSYVTVVYILVIPAALLCLTSEVPRARRLGAVTFTLVFANQVAMNSRTGMLLALVAGAAFLVSRLATSKLRLPELMLIPVLLLVPVGVATYGESSLDKVVNDMARTLHLTDEVTSVQDIDRRIWFEAAFQSLNNSDPLHALVGYGLRTSGYVVAPYVQEGFWIKVGRYQADDDVSVEGFTAIAVDLGYLGLGMFLVLGLSSAWAVFRWGRDLRLVFVLVPCGMLIVTLMSNVFDCLILYLALAPWGLTDALAGRPENPERKSENSGTLLPAGRFPR